MRVRLLIWGHYACVRTSLPKPSRAHGVERLVALQKPQRKICQNVRIPFAFYRGANHLFWMGFAGDPRL